MIGRLRAGVTMAEALDEAEGLGSAIRPPRPAGAPPLTGPRFEVQLLKEQTVRGLRPALRVLLAAVAALLLIVCANVANLLLARGTARQREIAVRSAIGASRGRVVRQLLTESLLLAAAGGALGALVGAAGVTLVKNLASIESPGIFRLVFGASILPRINEVGVDPRMFAIAFSIAALTSLIFGVLPALAPLARRRPVGSGSNERRRPRGIARPRDPGGRAGRDGDGAARRRRSARTQLRAAGHRRDGLQPVECSRLPAGVARRLLDARKTTTVEAVLARLRAAPNVEAAGFTRAGVLIPEEIVIGTFVPPGRSLDEMAADPVRPALRPVSAGYLTAIGSRLIEGRELTAADTATSTPSIVISRGVARRFFGAASAVGQFVDWHVGADAAIPVQVIGVVEDVRNESPDREAKPDIFIAYQQLLELSQRWADFAGRRDETALGFLSFAVRTRGDPQAAAPVVSRIVRAIDANAVVDAILPIDRIKSGTVARPRFYAVMLGAFAGTAAFLAAIGIYGVLAYAVVRRTQEIGIRMALGAQRAQVLALVLKRGLILTAIGIALGLGGAAAGSRLLQGMLFGVSPLDARTFAAVSLAFALVATFALYVPARRATRVDPMVALRTDG